MIASLAERAAEYNCVFSSARGRPAAANHINIYFISRLRGGHVIYVAHNNLSDAFQRMANISAPSALLS